MQNGTDGDYSYTLSNTNWVNRPIAYVDFWDAVRFANWLHNDQGNGDTETGSYTLTAEGIANNTVTRNAGVTFVVASNDEWHKAAYYDAALAITTTTTPPRRIRRRCTTLLPDPGNNANVYDGVVANAAAVLASSRIPRAPTARSTRRATSGNGPIRSIGRRSYHSRWSVELLANECKIGQTHSVYPTATTADNNGLGFRVVRVPEPSTAMLVVIGVLCVLWRRKR